MLDCSHDINWSRGVTYRRSSVVVTCGTLLSDSFKVILRVLSDGHLRRLSCDYLRSLIHVIVLGELEGKSSSTLLSWPLIAILSFLAI